MAVVNAYLPRPSQLMFETEEGQKVAVACVEFGGWHHREKKLTPIQLSTLQPCRAIPACFAQWTASLQRPKREHSTETSTSSNCLRAVKMFERFG